MAQNMAYEEFLARAKDASNRDPRLHRMVRGLLADRGVLAQICNELLLEQQRMKDVLAAREMFTDDAIRVAIGQQGVVKGFDNALQTIYNLTLESDNGGNSDTGE